MEKNKGQIWIETVIYTLIGLTLIAIVLVFGLPKINESRDRAVIEQSIDSLNLLDGKIREVIDAGSGNVRKINVFSIKRGELTINGDENSITFFLDDLAKPYSEPGESFKIGRINVLSAEERKKSSVKLTLDYENTADITFAGADGLRKFIAGSTPYSLTFENKGSNTGGVVIVNIEEVSGR